MQVARIVARILLFCGAVLAPATDAWAQDYFGDGGSYAVAPAVPMMYQYTNYSTFAATLRTHAWENYR